MVVQSKYWSLIKDNIYKVQINEVKIKNKNKNKGTISVTYLERGKLAADPYLLYITIVLNFI